MLLKTQHCPTGVLSPTVQYLAGTAGPRACALAPDHVLAGKIAPLSGHSMNGNRAAFKIVPVTKKP